MVDRPRAPRPTPPRPEAQDGPDIPGDGGRDAGQTRLPAGGAERLARMGRATAKVAGRSAAGMLRKLGADEAGRAAIDAELREANAAEILGSMTEMRGVFMKLGQLLSQQGHSLPEAYVRQMATLQRAAPPMHGSLMRIQFKNAMGDWPEQRFRDFEREPFAAASLGQVHRARLEDGTAVAVKIQYPGIERSIESDFRLLYKLIDGARLGGSRRSEVRRALDAVRQGILREVDYGREARSIRDFAEAFAAWEDIVIPEVHPEHSSERVLTMGLVEGHTLDADFIETLEQARRDAFAERLLALFFHQVFTLGRLHADPHPGNYLFRADGRIGIVDFGCVETIAPEVAEHLRALYRIPVDDAVALDALYRRLGYYDEATPDADARRDALLHLQRVNVGMFHQDRRFDFGDPALLRELGGALSRLARLGVLHPDFMLFQRTKLGLYGLFHQLGARVNAFRAVEPYRETGTGRE